MAKFIGIDYGRKHIGIAVAESEFKIATILDSLTVTKNKTPVKVLSDFLANQQNIQLLIIGFPQGLNQKPTQMSAEVTEFAKLVSVKTTIPHILWDETLTSRQGESANITKDKTKSHSQAARIILQEYLDSI